MKFLRCELPGVYRIGIDVRSDERGNFFRTYCESEFLAEGLNTKWPQCNTSITAQKGIIRGLHYQAAPHGETKLIRCVAGSIYDVVLDLRKGSATYGKWERFLLDSSRPELLYVPKGFAHGFQCLSDLCELSYMMSDSYVPELGRGVRWNDPELAIPWPISDVSVSPKDATLPLLAEQ